MHSIIYTSRALDSFDSIQVYQMLEGSRSYNAEHGITGCLLYHERQFVQILEGDYQVVDGLFQKIRHDQRHAEVSLLMEDNTDQRLFDNWNMGFYEFISKEERQLFRKHQFNQFFENSNLFSQSSKTGLLFFKRVRDLLESN